MTDTADPDALDDLDPDPVFAPWDGRRVPVTLLGGYLGAGKTTVANELLRRTSRPIAVLVNDVGSVNIDAAAIARTHGDTIELTDGCVCCSLSGGLADAFETLRRRPSPPDHVLIELSGVADPRRVAPWASSPGFRLDSIIVLVDADAFVEREADPSTGPHVRAQIDAADLMILSKLDIADASAVLEARERLARLAPGVPVIDGGPDVAAGLLDTGTRRDRDITTLPAPTLFDVHETGTVSLPRPTSADELARLVADLPDNVVRAKGVAEAADGARLAVQKVGRRVAIEPLPAAEAQAPTDLVVISVRS